MRGRLLACVLLAACGSSDNPPDAAVPLDMAAGDGLSADESTAFDRGTTPGSAVLQLTVLADSFFSFDPTLNPSLDANGNAAAIQAQLVSQLGAGDGGATACGNIMLSGATVTANFGTGCTLKNGVNIAGTVTATVTKSGASVTVMLDFSILVVNQKNLGGTATFTTTDGNHFVVNASLTAAGTTLTLTNVMVSSTSGVISLSGMVASGEGANLTFTAVTWKPTDCYPSSGTLQIKSGVITETITFDAATAATGDVTVTIGKRTIPRSLPAYGHCPAADGG
jgi:hypothetical protein